MVSAKENHNLLQEAAGKQGGKGWPQAWIHNVRSGLWQLATAFEQLLAPKLRRSSLLLMVIWLANALAYYGLVLLTTTVSTAKRFWLHACAGMSVRCTSALLMEAAL